MTIVEILYILSIIASATAILLDVSGNDKRLW